MLLQHPEIINHAMKPAIPEPAEDELPVYPAYCHDRSPTIGKWVPMRINDITTLKPGGWSLEDPRDESTRSRVYLFNNHPIRWVKVTAVVVQIDYHEKNNRKVFILDDGSGVCIECPALNAPKPVYTNDRARYLAQLDQIEADHRLEMNRGKTVKDQKNVGPSRINPTVPWNEIDIGTTVRVKGKIGQWNEENQVEAVIIEVVGLDAEVQAWNTARKFKTDVLDKPWVVTERQQEQCRRVYQKKLKRPINGGIKKKTTKNKNSTESRPNNQTTPKRKDPLPTEQSGQNTLKRKDLEKVQNMDRVTKKRKDAEAQQEAQKKKAECIALAIRQGAGKYSALGI